VSITDPNRSDYDDILFPIKSIDKNESLEIKGKVVMVIRKVENLSSFNPKELRDF